MKRIVILSCAIVLCCSTTFTAAAEPKIASSNGMDKGDHFHLDTDVNGFLPISTVAANPTVERCAGMGSTYSKVTEDDKFVYVQFYKVKNPKSKDTCLGSVTSTAGVTTGAPLAQYGSVYKISVENYKQLSFRSNGLAFGALVVPFKFRLGGDKKLVSSATIAPYIGLRWAAFQGFGFECMPVVSAGLALVPITPVGETTTETRSAFSTAIGFTVNSSKNPDFSAGVLLGRDYLNKADRLADPSVNKAWVSIWLGISK